ncbi:hypothetical protein LOK49_LG07G01120 [Camellia lanceoleosa]|uniref:Uncharacterized protein n=1 Tax=Camellia lanceoleosa TaxID=1840588 RepID=A0ACC0H7J7_9ERIC|nr:hypothetical protein LOK49_LG07G01120 [Camellia lanceoleosa]
MVAEKMRRCGFKVQGGKDEDEDEDLKNAIDEINGYNKEGTKRSSTASLEKDIATGVPGSLVEERNVLREIGFDPADDKTRPMREM